MIKTVIDHIRLSLKEEFDGNQLKKIVSTVASVIEPYEPKSAERMTTQL